MSEVIVKDVVLWTKHIHGDSGLRDHLSRLSAGSEIELLVDGVRGHWCKMADGRDGRPTTGLSPRGRMQGFWRELYASRRGEAVTIALSHQGAGGAARRSPETAQGGSGSVDRSRSVVEAARKALLTSRGWSSEGRTVTRDELHQR